MSARVQIDQAISDELADLAKAGDAEALSKLSQMHMGFIYKIAKRYVRRTRSMQVEELAQHGVLGIMRALEHWDRTRGNRFLTYASSQIEVHIQRAADNDNTLLYASSKTLQVTSSGRFWAKLTRLREEGVTEEKLPYELGRAFRCHPNKIRAMLRLLSRAVYSLDDQIAGQEDTSRYDLLPAEGPAMADVIDRKRLAEEVRSVLKSLWPGLREVEKALIEDRLMTSDDPQTLQHLGDRFGLSKERVRQLESQLLRNLKQALKRFDTEEPEPT